MPEGFLENWSRYLFNWFGFTFTVGAAIVGLVLAREHWWISILIVIAVVAASGLFAFRKHSNRQRDAEEFERLKHQLEDQLESAIRDRRDAERKLNEIPYELLMQLQQAIASHGHGELGQLLMRHADFVSMMKQFDQTTTRPISLRTFVHRSGQLYAVAKVKAPALDFVRTGDPFVLFKKTAAGLETPSAYLTVNQPPDPNKETIFFRIVEYISDEMEDIERLTQKSDIDGLKGYLIKLAINIADYEEFDAEAFIRIMQRMVEDAARLPRS